MVVKRVMCKAETVTGVRITALGDQSQCRRNLHARQSRVKRDQPTFYDHRSASSPGRQAFPRQKICTPSPLLTFSAPSEVLIERRTPNCGAQVANVPNATSFTSHTLLTFLLDPPVGGVPPGYGLI